MSLSLAQFEISDRVVFISSESAGVEDWVYPKANEMSWHNPLTGIVSYNNTEFNFVFKNGKTSDAPMRRSPNIVKYITPRNSFVRKVLIGYF